MADTRRGPRIDSERIINKSVSHIREEGPKDVRTLLEIFDEPVNGVEGTSDRYQMKLISRVLDMSPYVVKDDSGRYHIRVVTA